jgi:hypothetical protein
MNFPNNQDNFYRAIGRLVIEWSHLELSIKETIALCISDDQGLNDRITANEQLPALLTLLNSLFRYRVGDDKEHTCLKQLRTRIDKLADQRNKLIHSHWFVATINKEFLVRRDKLSKRAKDGLEFDIDMPTTDSLLKLIDDIKKTSLDIDTLRMKNSKRIKQHRRKVPKFPTYLMLHTS